MGTILDGIFFPRPETKLPIGLKRELFSVLSTEVGRQMGPAGDGAQNPAGELSRGTAISGSSPQWI
jgi:hypothetical protein